MQKKAFMLSLLGVSAASVAAVATADRTVGVSAVLPGGVQAASQPVPAPPQAAPAYVRVSPAISSALAQWNSLRQSDGFTFSSYASFLLAHRGWPGEAAMRRSAERAIDPVSSAPSQVVAFFRAYPPLTPAGHARHAFALLATGQGEAARTAARTAWAAGVMPRPDEDRLLTQFGSTFSPADHDQRMDVLLANRDLQSAQRMLPLVSLAQRPLFEARIALQTNAPDAAGRLAAAGATDSHAGVLMDRVNWLRSGGQALAARQLLATPRRLTARPANPETWLETLLSVAKSAAADAQWSTAYGIASQIDETYAPGTDVSARPYKERDAYTSLAWMAGDAALNKLGRPADAARMFERYARAARSPQTRAKGFYWASRAAAAAGQTAQSSTWIEEAAASPDQYYGQLALDKLGRQVTPPIAPMGAPAPAERSAFEARPLVQAIRALGDMGRWSDQSLFIRALAEQLESDSDRALAGAFGRTIGRPDLGVWAAREARNKGASFYQPAAFPEVQLPSAYQHRWSLAHGITRQESSFDRAAVSHAGARGLMQLMPGTARETAGRVGMPYDFGRLTNDPSYNIMLGTSYFSTLLTQWDGNVPLAVASYNAGAGNVRKWIAQNGDPRAGVDIVRWIEAIPFSETRNYVQRVLENAVVYDAIRAQRSGGGAGNRLSYYLGKAGPG